MRGAEQVGRGRRALLGAAATALVGTALVASTAEPAGASVTLSLSGTTITVTLVGNEGAGFDCVNGNVVIRQQTTTPALACSALTKVIVNGDSGLQSVSGNQLDDPPFTAKPSLEVHLGGGQDEVYETSRADTIDTGEGIDELWLHDGVANAAVDLGVGSDVVYWDGTDAVDDLTFTSTGPDLTLIEKRSPANRTETILSVSRLSVLGRGGNNKLDASGIAVSSGVNTVSLEGGEGDDVLKGAVDGSSLFGWTGKNTIVGGNGTGLDNIGTYSPDDTIDPNGGNTNWIFDRQSFRSGGRTILSTGGQLKYTFELPAGDVISRVRQGSGGASALVTNSLTRPGQQSLPSTTARLIVDQSVYPSPDDRALADVEPLFGTRPVDVVGDSYDDDLADITIPFGSWTTTGSPSTTYVVTPSDTSLGPITVTDYGQVRVHGPWTDANKSFVHRATRDLVFRFATSPTIDTTAAALAGGTTTRAAVVQGLMGSDEYRGLDVDRTFVHYLDRNVDPSGRAYWIKSIANGKALWRFRAQLFGSNEYFTKAGSDNGLYIDKAYGDVLGRAPDPSGRTYWTNKLNAGADRGSVALQFINSPEARRRLVDEQFLRFLDRYPTSTEQATWAATVAGSNTGEQQLIAFLATSGTYYGRD